MVKRIYSEKCNWLIENIFAKDFLSTSPVIAGGFALSIRMAIMHHDSDYKWNNFKKNFKKGRGGGWYYIPPFGDIDVWFLENNSIFSCDNKLNFLISYDSKDPTHSLNGREVRLIGESKWGNSFSTKPFCCINPLVKPACNLQVINTKYESVEQLLSSFDLENCKYAWHNGYLYFSNNAEQLFNSFTLSKSADRAYSSFQEKLFHGLRYFKYSSRYNLDFDKDLALFALNTYLDIDSERCTLPATNNNISIGVPNYGSSASSGSDMISEFLGYFDDFYQMKTFDKGWLPFLIPLADRIPLIKNLIESNGDLQLARKGLRPKEYSYVAALPF